MKANKILFNTKIAEQGITAGEFCKRIGINHSNLSNALSGRYRMGNSLKIIIAMELGADPQELWGLDPKEIYHKNEVAYIKQLIEKGVL